MKISDFGLSRTAGTEECNLVGKERQLQFPIRWTAPEVFSKLYVDKKTDVWSFGILFYEFVTAGSVPYAALSNAEVRKQVSLISLPVIQSYDIPHSPLCDLRCRKDIASLNQRNAPTHFFNSCNSVG